MSNRSTKLVLSEHDYKKLSALVASCDLSVVSLLEEEIGKAQILPENEVPEDAVTMHSRVRILDLDSHSETEITLVYPHEADPESQCVSVLAPMGMALIGLRQGQEYEWRMPNGRTKRFLVKAILARARTEDKQ